MKQVVITLTLECADDVPPHVLEWMAGNLAEHASNEFLGDYEEEFVDPPYPNAPLETDWITASVAVAFDPFAEMRRQLAETVARFKAEKQGGAAEASAE